jgi:hypothetical protein
LGVRDRLDRALLIGLVAAGAFVAGCSARGYPGERALIVTTSDVIAKTSPCGCHTPKGGFARRAAFLDSVRALRKGANAVLALDAGGFFPVVEDERDAGAYTLAAMGRMGIAAAGVGPNELRFGYSYLREHARAAGVPLIASNLERRDTHAPAFERWRVFRAGSVAVGAFSLVPESADLGPARDTLIASSAENAAHAAVDSLRAAGAQVIVLLSQLGEPGGDSLVRRVPGIDLIVQGGGMVPIRADGRRIGRTVALEGGTEGWQVGVAEVRPGAPGEPARIDARTFVLGPEYAMQPAMAASVKAFEDSLNANLRLRQAAYAPRSAAGASGPHYVGMSNCVACHASEYAQWQTTAHAHAWKTLADQHKESTPSCVPCHVTALGEPGGFQTGDDAARFGNVQCEACHGRGSDHGQWMSHGNTVPEATCRGCHTSTTSPTFSMALYRPHVLHQPPPGLQPMPESPAARLMRAGKPPHGR